MSDQGNQNQTLTTFLPVFATAGISATTGQEAAGNMADTVNWLVSLWCQCDPPAFVQHTFKDGFTLLFLAGGLYIHYLYQRKKTQA